MPKKIGTDSVGQPKNSRRWNWNPLAAKTGVRKTDKVRELTDEEKIIIARRREQLETQVRAKEEARRDSKIPIVFPKLSGGKVFVINHHWSWVIFHDPWLNVILLGCVGLATYPLWGFLAPTYTFEPSIQFFITLGLFALASWLRIELWKRDRWEIQPEIGALRDIDIRPWFLLQEQERIAGGRSGISNWEVKKPTLTWFFLRVGHIEFEGVAEKELLLPGIKYPDLISNLLSVWRNGGSIEKIETNYLEWKAKRTPIERFCSWLFSLRHTPSRIRRFTVGVQDRRRKKKPSVERMTEEPPGSFVEVAKPDDRTVIHWYMVFDQPKKYVTSCGVLNCSEVIGGRIEGEPAFGIVINLPETGEKVWYFHNRVHFELILRELRSQRVPRLKWLSLPPEVRAKFAEAQYA